MRLVYKSTNKEVQIGDTVTLRDGVLARIEYFTKPHKPSSSGKVTVFVLAGDQHVAEYYVGVIGAEWIEREDRLAQGAQCELVGRNWT